jgi:predicted O-methyltransferase YrrM
MKQNKYEEHIEDLLALQVLSALFPDEYVPITSSSLRPQSLVYVLNDILINGRKTILEFGCGISTLLFGMLSKSNDLNLNIISVDHDADWIMVVKKYIEKYALKQYVTLVHTPLIPYKCNSFQGLEWYDVKYIENYLSANFKQFQIDLVLIDGPPAYEKSIQFSRYPAMEFVINKLNSDRFSIFIDDTNRTGEKKIIELWEKEYGLKFKYLSKDFSFVSRGNSFNIK